MQQCIGDKSSELCVWLSCIHLASTTFSFVCMVGSEIFFRGLPVDMYRVATPVGNAWVSKHVVTAQSGDLPIVNRVWRGAIKWHMTAVIWLALSPCQIFRLRFSRVLSFPLRLRNVKNLAREQGYDTIHMKLPPKYNNFIIYMYIKHT